MADPDMQCSMFKGNGTVTSIIAPSDPDQLLSKKRVGHFALGPRASYPVGRVAMQEAEIDRRAQTETPFYISGIIRYRDIFEGSVDHVTKYCFNVTTWPDTEGRKSPFFAPCRDWNCTDDECKRP